MPKPSPTRRLPPNDSDTARPCSFIPSSTPHMQSQDAITSVPCQRLRSTVPSHHCGW